MHAFSLVNKLNFGFIWKISMFAVLIDEDIILMMTGLAVVYRFKWCI